MPVPICKYLSLCICLFMLLGHMSIMYVRTPLLPPFYVLLFPREEIGINMHIFNLIICWDLLLTFCLHSSLLSYHPYIPFFHSLSLVFPQHILRQQFFLTLNKRFIYKTMSCVWMGIVCVIASVLLVWLLDKM